VVKLAKSCLFFPLTFLGKTAYNNPAEGLFYRNPAGPAANSACIFASRDAFETANCSGKSVISGGLEKMREDVIPIHTRSETVALKKDNIIYVESQLRLLIIHTIAKEYKYYGKLSELMELLGEPFYRCHASLAINMDKLESAGGCVLNMEGGHDIVLGRNKYQAVRRRFLEYLRKNCEESKRHRQTPPMQE
jgi:hypothetical protein